MVERKDSSPVGQRSNKEGGQRLLSLDSNGQEEVKGEVGGTIGTRPITLVAQNNPPAAAPAAPQSYFQRMCAESAQNIEERMKGEEDGSPPGEAKKSSREQEGGDLVY